MYTFGDKYVDCIFDDNVKYSRVIYTTTQTKLCMVFVIRSRTFNSNTDTIALICTHRNQTTVTHVKTISLDSVRQAAYYEYYFGFTWVRWIWNVMRIKTLGAFGIISVWDVPKTNKFGLKWISDSNIMIITYIFLLIECAASAIIWYGMKIPNCSLFCSVFAKKNQTQLTVLDNVSHKCPVIWNGNEYIQFSNWCVLETWSTVVERNWISKVQWSEWVGERANEYATHIFCSDWNWNVFWNRFFHQLYVSHRLITFSMVTVHAESILIKNYVVLKGSK